MSPTRVQRQRRKGSKMPKAAVYVGRGSRFGNPWRVERFTPVPGDSRAYAAVLRDHRGTDHVHPFETYRGAAARAVAGYQVHIMRGDGPTKAEIATLTGKNLACWCKPDMPCHADILLKLANPHQPNTNTTGGQMSQQAENFPERVARVQEEQNIGIDAARRIAASSARIERARRGAELAALAESLRRTSTNPQMIADPSKGKP